MYLGDDLSAARQFIDAAEGQIEGLFAGDHMDHHTLVSTATRLRDGAMKIKARGISRRASELIDAVNASGSQDHIEQLLIGLNHLVEQYAEGLDEIAPVDVTIADDSLRSASDTAREILTPLIKFADMPGQAVALQALVAYSPTPHFEVASGVSLEALMPAITDHILSMARQAGKSVSVSYAANDISVAEELAAPIQDLLTELGARLVNLCLEAPLKRQVAGLPASGLLSLTAHRQQGVLSLSAECTGKMVDLADLDLTSLSMLDGVISVRETPDGVSVRASRIAIKSVATSIASQIYQEGAQ